MNIFRAVDSALSSPTEFWFDRDHHLHEDSTSRFAPHHTSPAIGNDDIVLSAPMSLNQPEPHAVDSVHRSSENDWHNWDLDMVPALTRSNSNASTPSETEPDSNAGVIQGGFVMESRDGVLVRPTRLLPGADLLCPFQVLDCDAVSAEVREFKTHFFSHFHGHHLPAFATCFICGSAWFRSPHQDPSLVWNQMLDHMVYDHFRAGQDVAIFKPSMAVMRHMWNRGIITDAQLKRCQLVAEPTQLPRSPFPPSRDSSRTPPAPMPPHAIPPAAVQAHLNQSIGTQSEAVVIMAGRRLERRQRDTDSLRARVRGYS